jgi:hypothetical protein
MVLARVARRGACTPRAAHGILYQVRGQREEETAMLAG